MPRTGVFKQINLGNPMKLFMKIMSVPISVLLISACATHAPPRSDATTGNNVELLDYDAHNIERIKPLRMRISSQKKWQNTAVFVQPGDVVSVIAHGTWSPWPEMALWAGPDGNELWNREVSDISGSALMARLGYQGRPFQVGSSRTFRAHDYGILYMAMNDPFKNLDKNKGDMNVDIYIDANRNLQAGVSAGSSTAYKIIAYHYDDRVGKGYISALTRGNDVAARRWLLNKIGEIASSKNGTTGAGNNPTEGSTYRVTNEKIANGIVNIEFVTIW